MLGPLAERDISLLVAVTPDDLSGLPRVLESALERGVDVGIWPMLERRDGRWPNAQNVAKFGEYVRRLLDALEARRLRPRTLAVDLEPPVEELDRVFHGDVRAATRWIARRGLGRARRAFSEIVDEVRSRGVSVFAAAIPAVVGARRSSLGWQRALGTPVDGIAFDRVSPMMYTSLIEGYARGLLRREDTVSVLALVARSVHERFGPRASLSLGAVGHGILGDEPTFRSVDELREDVAQARAAGVDDLALFDLAGVLARAPVEPWLDAFVETPPAARPAQLTPRAAFAVGATVASGTLMSLF